MGSVGKVFLALDPPEEVRHHLAARLSAAYGGNPIPGKRVEPVDWHVTVRFLGEPGGPRLDLLSAMLDDADLGRAFRITLGGVGAFPRPDRAQVVWVGVDGGDPLTDLRREVEDACVDAGLGREGRPFVPHLTVSRIRPALDVLPWLAEDPDLRTRWSVESLTLFRSRPSGGGYERVDVFPLR